MRHDRRLRILRQLQLIVRTFAHQPEQVLAQRLVDFVENVLRGSARLRERRAHADRLAALPRKNECAHRSPCWYGCGAVRRGRADCQPEQGAKRLHGRSPSTSTRTRNPARMLGKWMSAAMVVGTMVGSGIYLLPTTLAPYGTTGHRWSWSPASARCAWPSRWRGWQRRSQAGHSPTSNARSGETTAFLTLWCYTSRKSPGSPAYASPSPAPRPRLSAGHVRTGLIAVAIGAIAMLRWSICAARVPRACSRS